MNSITELLNLKDFNIFISDITIQCTTNFLTLEKYLEHNMYSLSF